MKTPEENTQSEEIQPLPPEVSEMLRWHRAPGETRFRRAMLLNSSSHWLKLETSLTAKDAEDVNAFRVCMKTKNLQEEIDQERVRGDIQGTEAALQETLERLALDGDGPASVGIAAAEITAASDIFGQRISIIQAIHINRAPRHEDWMGLCREWEVMNHLWVAVHESRNLPGEAGAVVGIPKSKASTEYLRAGRAKQTFPQGSPEQAREIALWHGAERVIWVPTG